MGFWRGRGTMEVQECGFWGYFGLENELSKTLCEVQKHNLHTMWMEAALLIEYHVLKIVSAGIVFLIIPWKDRFHRCRNRGWILQDWSWWYCQATLSPFSILPPEFRVVDILTKRSIRKKYRGFGRTDVNDLQNKNCDTSSQFLGLVIIIFSRHNLWLMYG